METHCGLGVMYTMNIKFDVAFTMNMIIVAMNIFTIILCYTFLYCSIAYVSVFSYVLLYIYIYI